MDDNASGSGQDPFEAALSDYVQGEAPETLIPRFMDIINRSPSHSAAWTCLCWLQLLANRPMAALKSGRVAVRLAPGDPQARINLSLAMLETGTKGVRHHVEQARQVVAASPDTAADLRQSIADGLMRRSSWAALEKVEGWLAAELNSAPET